jgi:hypothetical protein
VSVSYHSLGKTQGGLRMPFAALHCTALHMHALYLKA